MSSENFWNLGAEQNMTVKALSSLVRNLVRLLVKLLVKLLVNNARKGACSYRTAGYGTATTRCVFGLWMSTTQASTDQGTSVYLTRFSRRVYLFPRQRLETYGFP